MNGAPVVPGTRDLDAFVSRTVKNRQLVSPPDSPIKVYRLELTDYGRSKLTVGGAAPDLFYDRRGRLPTRYVAPPQTPVQYSAPPSPRRETIIQQFLNWIASKF